MIGLATNDRAQRDQGVVRGGIGQPGQRIWDLECPGHRDDQYVVPGDTQPGQFSKAGIQQRLTNRLVEP